jgi:hypothetical protein
MSLKLVLNQFNLIARFIDDTFLVQENELDTNEFNEIIQSTYF